MNLTQSEMQTALILWGRENFAKRMGIAPSEVAEFCKTHGLLPPAENLRRLASTDKEKLMRLIIEHSDLVHAAVTLGVSKATLKNELSNIGIQNGTRKVDELVHEEVEGTAVRTGSISLTAALYHTTETVLGKLGLERKTISDPSKHGYRARTGRMGEMAMMEALNEAGLCPKDMNTEKGFNTPGVDIEFTPKEKVGV